MQYLKEHMAYQYDWLPHTASLYTGSPSRRVFDPRNGIQVLFIINCFCQSIGLTSLTDSRRMEELIYTQLPVEMKSELTVFNWLKGIYLYYAG
ncbi:hypothetical protein HB364_14205 [Pseudoflavitalea sp. X16]|uniref:hypothetical protein n=1 Tax=Paraflavitalea devenefica TaxID=2716334 RepID=UPI00142220BA|nr:hypothetical protein [Paraflavitalea devenefica]NII26240.1 hypothetical protein [Paraflavitalea devenefica]